MQANKTNGKKSKHSTYSEISHQAEEVVNEAKKLGNQIYQEGKHRLDDIQGDFKAHSDKLIDKVHKSPMSSLLIAAGIGFIVGRIFNR